MNNQKTYRSQFLLLIVVLLFCFVVNISLGSVSIPLKSIFGSLFGTIDNSTWQIIVTDFRLPKAITAILVGSGLGISGLLMQTLFRNPLAGPFVLGISSGASLGVAIVILGAGIFGGAFTTLLVSKWSVVIAASLGSFLVLLAVLAVSTKVRDTMAILIIGLWIAKLLTKVFNKVLIKKEVDSTLIKFFTAMVRVALIVFVVIAAISQAGIETASFVAVIGAAGLAVGFALQGSLSNFASGVMLIIFRPIKVGDFIEGGGISGSVKEIGIFVTTLISPDNKVIFVPNSKMTSDNIINYSMNDTRRVDLTFGIGYGDDIDKAKKVINEVLEENNNILKDPAPTVQLNELADSSVNFIVRPWVKTENYWLVYWGLTETMKKKFDEQNIEFPYPQTDVHIHKN